MATSEQEQLKALLDEERAKHAKRMNLPAVPKSVFGPPNPTADELEKHYLEAAEPFVRGVRELTFDTPDPPFEGDEAGATAWLVEHRGRKEKALFGRSTFPRKDRRFAKGVDELERVTGFSRETVYVWLLTGAKPRLSPFVIRPQHHALPGTKLRTRRVEITINARLKRDEKRRIWETLKGQWEQVDAEGGFIVLPQRIHGLTEKNRAVKELWDRTPKPPWTWAKRSAEWNSEQESSFNAHALRVHWNRLKDKLDDLGIPYRPDTDDG